MEGCDVANLVGGLRGSPLPRLAVAGGNEMSRRYPRVRRHAEIGSVLVSEGVILCFFMRRSHAEVMRPVMRALEAYRRAVGERALGWYPDMNGDWQPLEHAGWEHIHREMQGSPEGARILLKERPDGVGAYQFSYHGNRLDAPWYADRPGVVSAASFWLPVDYLEGHGPGRVRELALELARELPLSSGYVSLGF